MRAVLCICIAAASLFSVPAATGQNQPAPVAERVVDQAKLDAALPSGTKFDAIVETDDGKQEMVCERTMLTGSRLSKRACRTAAEHERELERGHAARDELERPVRCSLGGVCRGG